MRLRTEWVRHAVLSRMREVYKCEVALMTRHLEFIVAPALSAPALRRPALLVRPLVPCSTIPHGTSRTSLSLATPAPCDRRHAAGAPSLDGVQVQTIDIVVRAPDEQVR